MPQTWMEALKKLRGEFVTEVIIQSFADVFQYELLIVTISKVIIIIKM